QPTYLNRKRSGNHSMLVKLLSHAAKWQDGQQGVLHMAKATLPESQSSEFMLLQGRTAVALVFTQE
ncbi:hypothetical protein MNBD_ALPHA03-45, partial [hydrothermal vent metagenome]